MKQRIEINGKVIILQPALPNCRRGLFERIARQVGPRFSVYASKKHLGVLTSQSEVPTWQRNLGPMQLLYKGLEWQQGAFSVATRRVNVIFVSGAPPSGAAKLQNRLACAVPCRAVPCSAGRVG